MDIKAKKSVMFVTKSQDASIQFTRWFEQDDSYLKDNYYIDGTLPTREMAVKEATKKKIDLVIFTDQTPGNLSLSETIYRLRLRDCRIIYISQQRRVGDLVLDAIVSYGVYDLILSSEITLNKLVDIIKHPYQFSDVAIFHRLIDVSDTTGVNGIRKFKVLGLDEYLAVGGHLESDYLSDPAEQVAAQAKSYINNKEDNLSAKSVIYREEPVKKSNRNTKKVTKAKPTNNQGIGDIDDLFE